MRLLELGRVTTGSLFAIASALSAAYCDSDWLACLEPVREKVGSGEAVVIPWSALLSGRRADVEG